MMAQIAGKLGIQIVTLLLLFRLISATSYAIISPSTPPEWTGLLQEQTTLPAVVKTAETKTVDLLVDASYEEQTAASLSALCRELQIPLLVLGPVSVMYEKEWTYYLGGVHSQMAAALDSTLKCLSISSANLIGDSSSYSLHLRAALHDQNSSVDYSELIVSDTDSLEALVGKVLRPKGNRVTLFTTEPALTKRLLKAQFHMHIGGAGYANLMPEHSALFPLQDTDTEDNLRNGNLIVAERADLSSSAEESASQVYTLIEPYLTLKSTEAKTLLNSNFPTHTRSALKEFLILNVQNSTKVTIGSIHEANCFLTSSISFLGGSPSISQTSTSIQISGNFGQMDVVYGFAGSDSATAAAVEAIAEINAQSSILRNFHLDLWNFTGGVISFDAGLIEREVMPHKEKLGSAVMANVGSTNTMPLVKYLREHGVNTPVVGASTSDAALSSQTDYPNFIRLCLSDDYLNIVMVQTIKRLGWTKCSLIVVDRISGLEARTALLQLLPRSGIEVVNSAENQVISASVKNLEEARKNFTSAFQHVINTRCRLVVVISSVVSSYIPLVFYELGMRRGDLVIFGRYWIAPFTFTTRDGIDLEQVAEVMYGSLQLSPDFWVGQVGRTFYQKYSELTHLPPSSYPCLFYDAAYTIAHALSWLIQSGKDYLNSTEMTKALRNVRFIGCTGFVYFESSTNDRQPMRYTLDTLRYNATSGLYIQKLGVYDPAGVVLLTLDDSFVWGDGTNNIPSNSRESSQGCPFEDRLTQPFQTGRHLLIGVSLAFFLLTAMLGLLCWWRFRSPLQSLTAECYVESDDMLVTLTMCIDLLQAFALCTSASISPLRRFFAVTVGDFAEVRDLNDGGFQSLWLLTMGMVASFVILTAWLHCSICHFGEGITHTLFDLWTYICAHWLLVPTAMILLSSFDCTQGVAVIGESASFSSSYLSADCYLTCWGQVHTVVWGLSVVTLLIYLPIAMIYRTIWQASRDFLNIRTNVTFLSWTPALQVLLVALYVNFRKSLPVLHSILYLVLWTCRLAYCVACPTYGYERLRLRHLYGSLIVMWFSLASLLRLTIPQSEFVIMLLLFGISAAIFAAGEAYVLLKVKNLLHRPKGIDTFHLFKFAFKPATNEILCNLRRELELSGNRCILKSYMSVEGVSEARERAMTTGQHLTLVA